MFVFYYTFVFCFLYVRKKKTRAHLKIPLAQVAAQWKHSCNDSKEKSKRKMIKVLHTVRILSPTGNLGSVISINTSLRDHALLMPSFLLLWPLLLRNYPAKTIFEWKSPVLVLNHDLGSLVILFNISQRLRNHVLLLAQAD